MPKNQVKVTLCIIFLCLMATILGIAYFSNKDYSNGYILFSNITGFYCTNKNCKNIDIEDIASLKEAQRIFQTYVKDGYFGEYRFEYTSKWNLFASNGKWKSMTRDFLAVNPSLNAKVENPVSRKLTEKELQELQSLLDENDFEGSYTLSSSIAYDVDMRGNKEKDTLYIASNSDTSKDSNYFTICYAKTNGKLEVLEYSESKNSLSLPIYNMDYVIIIGNEKPIMVINKGYFSQVNLPSVSLYQVKRKKLELLATGQKPTFKD